ncbi:MAG: HAD hydrolase family protein [Candidatus Woesearchaeota archaeon]
MLESVLPGYRNFFDEDDILINRLSFDKKGKIVRMSFTKYDFHKKALGLKKIARRHNLSTQECVFVGDHHNDIEIAKTAWLSISFNSKSRNLDKVCDVVIKRRDLRKILHYLH